MQVYLKGKKIVLNPAQSIGKGGEADIYSIGGGHALKVFKGPDHADFTGQPLHQEMAQKRLAIHQKKLREFPANLPAKVVSPLDLAFNGSGTFILGYSMNQLDEADVLARFSDRALRQGIGDFEIVQEIFLDLHSTLLELHRKGIVIGDFNDLNILVRGTEAWIIDSDSFQFGNYPCMVFTLKFVDPLLCGLANGNVNLSKSYNTNSDWFSFAAMLMECLLFVNPWGGVFRPKNQAQRIPHEHRPLNRISVFHPEVRYPNVALPLETLPEEILEVFHRIFTRDQRGIFPDKLIRSMQWTSCTKCGFEHSRSSCPKCSTASPLAPKPLIVVNGNFSSRLVFSTDGRILFSTVQAGKLHYIYHEKGEFKRESGSTICQGVPERGIRFDLTREETFLGLRNTLLAFDHKQGSSKKISIDTCEGIPQFASNGKYLYCLDGGTLFRRGDLAPEPIGEILDGQTRFWVGPAFGFGFYRAGKLCVAFVFETRSRGLNDRVTLPAIPGQLIGASCFFSESFCWFFASSRDQGKTIFHCSVIRPDGSIEGNEREEGHDKEWMTSLGGKCAIGNMLFAATDSGLIRLEINGGRISETRRFSEPGTSIHSACSIFLANGGLYVVDETTIRLLEWNK